MPEYLAPGVYVEETSFRSKSIEGVSTTTTGFVGPTRTGPVDLEPDIITSLGEFERTYGDGEPLDYDGQKFTNYMWHAARAFFTEGGKRLYVSRVYKAKGGTGVASASRNGITVAARYPGKAGEYRVRITARSGRNLLGTSTRDDPASPGTRVPVTTLVGLSDRDVAWVRDATESPSVAPFTGRLYVVERNLDAQPFPWSLGGDSVSPAPDVTVGDLRPSTQRNQGDSLRIVTLAVTVFDAQGREVGTWADLPVDPEHRTAGMSDSIFAVFGDDAAARGLPITVSVPAGMDGVDVLDALFDASPSPLYDQDALAAGVSVELSLTNGSDGERPEAAEYEGKDDPAALTRTGLKQFEALEDISIVAAPGSTANYAAYRDNANTIIGLLLAHAANMRYRIAVLDCAEKQTIADVRGMRAKIDSKYGALYYPWVKILDPITRQTIFLPPSGFVAGVYARNDVNRAVFKAPANEVVNLALGFETMLSKAQQDVLNPEGINCFRFFEGRGMLVWGARTVSSDPEWKYVNLRRYFAYLERSVDRGTQWAVFEPNGERLWANVRRTIEDFLLNEWQMGALLGDKPEKAYFVKCDRTTMTQNDLDNGRLVCLIGVAALKPAEFVIFRIGQWTADQKI